jgi:hypothetical protein
MCRCFGLGLHVLPHSAYEIGAATPLGRDTRGGFGAQPAQGSFGHLGTCLERGVIAGSGFAQRGVLSRERVSVGDKCGALFAYSGDLGAQGRLYRGRI